MKLGTWHVARDGLKRCVGVVAHIVRMGWWTSTASPQTPCQPYLTEIRSSRLTSRQVRGNFGSLLDCRRGHDWQTESSCHGLSFSCQAQIIPANWWRWSVSGRWRHSPAPTASPARILHLTANCRCTSTLISQELVGLWMAEVPSSSSTEVEAPQLNLAKRQNRWQPVTCHCIEGCCF